MVTTGLGAKYCSIAATHTPKNVLEIFFHPGKHFNYLHVRRGLSQAAIRTRANVASRPFRRWNSQFHIFSVRPPSAEPCPAGNAPAERQVAETMHHKTVELVAPPLQNSSCSNPRFGAGFFASLTFGDVLQALVILTLTFGVLAANMLLILVINSRRYSKYIHPQVRTYSLVAITVRRLIMFNIYSYL